MSLEVPLRIHRQKEGIPPHRDLFRVTVADTATVLDAIEAVWAQQDRTIQFRHACHHASCGSCAVRVNGIERLPCVTAITDVWDGTTDVIVEPLRNFPVIADLVVDVGTLFDRLEASEMRPIRPVEHALPVEIDEAPRSNGSVVAPAGIERFMRFESCIECGICVSACPTAALGGKFYGPAGLAAAQRARAEAATPTEVDTILAGVDGEHGVWRCHSAWECTERCPQGLDPAGAIMSLRRELTARRLRRLFRR
jgi:succinate dehydrogenase / fumarate reductase iron-sulfur subunit